MGDLVGNLSLSLLIILLGSCHLLSCSFLAHLTLLLEELTIVDDGSGTIFTGAVDPETGEAETTTIGLDNDGYEIKALCGWETSTYWQGNTFVTQHYNTENGRTVMSWETDGYTSFEIF